jgi:hypothetical protein
MIPTIIFVQSSETIALIMLRHRRRAAGGQR